VTANDVPKGEEDAFAVEGLRTGWLRRMIGSNEGDAVWALVGWLQIDEPRGFEHDSESEAAGVEVSTLGQLVGHDHRI
jgi:hypothetical protein